MEDSKGWSSSASALGVVFLGPPGGKVVLESMEILPSRFPYSIYTALEEATSFAPWQHSSINSYVRGGSVGSAPNPVFVSFTVFSVALLLYFALLLFFRMKLRFQWGVVAMVFLLSWAIPDILWQGRLLRQAGLTLDTFSGKSPVEKRQVGDDQELFRLMAAVHEAVDSPSARVFVSSSSDYKGMRSSYYLYPLNVFWQRNAKGILEQQSLHAGDYVLLLPPSPLRFDQSTGYLVSQPAFKLKVRPVLSSDLGLLYRVM